MKQFIEFKKQRDLGAILSDAFGFIRNEFKPFITIILQIIAPYLIAMFIAMGLYFYVIGDFVSFANNIESSSANFSSQFLIFGLVLIFFLIAVLIAYIMAHATILFYIKSYIENNGVINPQEIKANVKDYFWSFTGLGFLKGLAMFFGFMLCVFPGIYLMVPLSIVFCLMVFKNMSATDAFSESFNFIKDEWWNTFLTIFIVGIIVGVMGSAFGMPAAIYSWIKMGVFSGEIDPESQFEVFKDPVYILLNVINYAFTYFLNFISIIAAVFIYFNINEKKYKTGTLERIESIGKTNR